MPVFREACSRIECRVTALQESAVTRAANLEEVSQPVNT